MFSIALLAILIAAAIQPSPFWAMAPDDRHSICRTDFRYRRFHDWIPYANDTSSGNWRVLLDQNDYQNILGGFPPGEWTSEDFDGDGRTFVQGNGGTCTWQLRAAGTFSNPNTNNWVFTQAVDYIEAVEVIVNVTVRFTGCTDRPSCTDDFVTLHRYDTNSPNGNQQIIRSNYQYYLGNELSSRLQQNVSGRDTTIVRRFPRPANFAYTYFGIQDTGTFGNIIRLLVYYEVCPGRLGHLVIYPEIPLPPQGSFLPTIRMAQCVKHAHNKTSLETRAYSNGQCVQNVMCACDTGYERQYNDPNEYQCTACHAGEYRSALNNSCVFCPGNSTSTIAETECSCISGHYRAHYEGLGISCTAPPPPISNCVASEAYDTAASVQWMSPPHCGGRSDCYYLIAINGDAPTRYEPTNFKFNTTESFPFTDLKPQTIYSVNISIHNGVSDQDSANAKLRQCCVDIKTTRGSVFMLSGVTYPNNTAVIIEHIGESDGNALQCTTTLESCCQNHSQGNFYYPNGSVVLSKSQTSKGGMYNTRASGSISLRQKPGVPAPLGRYRCEIPDERGVSQNLYITLGTTTPNTPDECTPNDLTTDIACPTLGPPDNGQVTLFRTFNSSLVVYRCNVGYEFAAGAIIGRICNKNGTWTGDTPVCEKAKSCPQLRSPINGLVTITRHWGTLIVPGSIAVYTCDVHYKLIGNYLRKCQDNATWSHNEPTCEAITCPALEANHNESVVQFGNTVGSVAFYHCDEDPESMYTERDIRVCGRNGIWSGQTSSCGLHTLSSVCPVLDNPDRGWVTTDGNRTQGTVATYYCNENLLLLGNVSRTCLSNGMWSGKQPTCERLTFELNGQVYPNGSSLALSSIGEGDNALLCVTDGECCTPPNRAGEFYYPNGHKVNIQQSSDDLYRNRGEKMIRLNRRNGASSPTGTYRCEIPDSTGLLQDIFITLN